MLDLQPIKDRLAMTTPGPWRATQFGFPGEHFWGVAADCGDEIVPHDFYHVCSMEFSPCDDAQSNAEFVAGAKQDVAILIEEVERLRTEKADYEADRLDCARQINDLGRKVEDLQHANISLKNTMDIRVAAPPSTLAKLHAEVERLREAIAKHRETGRRMSNNPHDRDLWEMLE